MNVTEHIIRFDRYSRGRAPWAGGGSYVGYRLLCSCGWETRVNAPKKEARKVAKDHAKNYVEGYVPYRKEH